MDSQPLISVIIPVYNVENYLRECLDSVLNQTYLVFEAILIDDGSTDFSGTICDEYAAKDSRIRVIHQQNKGLGYARNVGINEASGKYIIFLDSDDYWHLNTLEDLVKEAEKNDLQVIVFSAQPFYDGIEQLSNLTYNHTVQNNIVKTGIESLAYAKARGEYYSQACLRFYRLEYIKENGFQFDEGIIHEDESFSFLAYINAERIECLGERYYMRRYRPGSIMANRDPYQSAHGYSVATDTLLQYMQTKTMSPLEKKLFNKQIIGYILMIFSRYKESKRKQGKDFKSGQEVYSNSKRIITDTQGTIKQVCRKAEDFPLHYRLILYNFQIGYHFWLLHEKVTKLAIMLQL